jgi:endonuclease YncB( thermonuclease family)
VHGCRRRALACGAAATKYAAELAGGRAVECLVIGLDKCRPLLGTCGVLDDEGKPDAVSLNARMATAGLAVAYRRFSQAYVGAEDEARTAKRGVWQGEFEMPWDYRARQKAR